MYLYTKDPLKAKYQLLIRKRGNVGLKDYNDPKAFTEYLNDIQDVNKNIEEYNTGKERKVLTVSDEMITDIISNKKPSQIMTDPFVTGRRLNISLVFIIQSYFKVPKDIRLKSTYYYENSKQKRPSINCN